MKNEHPKTTHTVSIVRRTERTVSNVLDVTGWSSREFDKMWDGLVMKVDFEEWGPVYSPPRSDTQSVAEWLR